jgi:plasmid stabilization system protein ParE
MKPVLLHDEARVELDEAAGWYERQRPGLGGEFRAAVEDAVARIQQNSQLGSRFAATRFRYRTVRRFPYIVFYVEGKSVIRVMAIAHGSRRPGYWRGRSVQ